MKTIREQQLTKVPEISDTSIVQPGNPRLRGESQKRGAERVCEPETQDACCETVTPRLDRENASMKYQQYGCIHKTEYLAPPLGESSRSLFAERGRISFLEG